VRKLFDLDSTFSLPCEVVQPTETGEGEEGSTQDLFSLLVTETRNLTLTRGPPLRWTSIYTLSNWIMMSLYSLFTLYCFVELLAYFFYYRGQNQEKQVLTAKFFVFGFTSGLFASACYVLYAFRLVQEAKAFAEIAYWTFILILYGMYSFFISSWIQALGSFREDISVKTARIIRWVCLFFIVSCYALALVWAFTLRAELLQGLYIYFILGLLFTFVAFSVLGIRFHREVKGLPSESEVRKKKLKVCLFDFFFFFFKFNKPTSKNNNQSRANQRAN